MTRQQRVNSALSLSNLWSCSNAILTSQLPLLFFFQKTIYYIQWKSHLNYKKYQFPQNNKSSCFDFRRRRDRQPGRGFRRRALPAGVRPEHQALVHPNHEGPLLDPGDRWWHPGQRRQKVRRNLMMPHYSRTCHQQLDLSTHTGVVVSICTSWASCLLQSDREYRIHHIGGMWHSVVCAAASCIFIVVL